LGGWVADSVNLPAAFCGLALVGLVGTLVLWLAMPETGDTAT
jgi:predicted MFS family arabinose efflux permease